MVIRVRKAILPLVLPPILALVLAGCALPKTAAYFHPSAADMGPSLDNYGEAIVPVHGLIVLQGDDFIYGSAERTRGRDPINGSQAPRGPVSLSEAMRTVLHGVQIENHGYAGDSIVDGFERWGGSPKGDLLVLSYGFGDVRAQTPV